MRARFIQYGYASLVLFSFSLLLVVCGCGTAKDDARAPGMDDGDTVAVNDTKEVEVQREDDEPEAAPPIADVLSDEKDASDMAEAALPPDRLDRPRMIRTPDTAPRMARSEEEPPQVDNANETPETAVTNAGDPHAEPEEASKEEKDPYDVVTVFYATDRKAVSAVAAEETQRRSLVLLVSGTSVTLLLGALGMFGVKRRLTFGVGTIVLALTIVQGGLWGYGQLEKVRRLAEPSVRYGNERGTMELGTCRVSIPWKHETGALEAPTILRLEVREDVRKHIVLHTIEPESDDTFFQKLRTRVQSASRSEVLVFVHGYNVTFDNAARRTAQIAYDVQFAGAPIFFSWPSQGGLLQYTVDETNVAWAVPHLKQFLLDVVHHSGAKSVNLIAHSMGNRALTAALHELQMQFGEEATLFNQIILAAPDVDAEIFRRDLAPALVASAEHVTLYASSNDQALIASKKVHGNARAGDSGNGLVVMPGIETIDVSILDTSLLGHSYYGSSNPILSDIHQLIHDSQRASQRRWLHPRTQGGLTYWVFEKMRDTAARKVDGHVH